MLPAGPLDRVLLVDACHGFQDPEAMLDRIRAALVPGGRVALVEYRLKYGFSYFVLGDRADLG